jgi:hypothetical protein
MDRIKAFFHSRWFDAHYKTKVHIGQIILVILIIALTGARIATKPKGMPTTRADTLAITMVSVLQNTAASHTDLVLRQSIKTIVVLSYQLITEHVAKYKRWGSLKAYAVLNTMEIVFWFVVIIITFMGISRYCKGANCAMGFFVALTAFALMYVFHSHL